MGFLLGIAAGAVKIGQKIFGKIKERKEAKIEKKASQLAEAKLKLAGINEKFNFTPGIVDIANKDKADLLSRIGSLINPDAGSQSISSAGNTLAALKGNEIQPTAANVALEERVRPGGGDNQKMIMIIGAVLVGILILPKLLGGRR